MLLYRLYDLEPTGHARKVLSRYIRPLNRYIRQFIRFSNVIYPLGYGTCNHPALKKIIPLKAAVVLSAIVAGGAGWEYALTFAKNIFTSKVFHKESFSDIANLTDNTVNVRKNNEDSPVIKKSKKRIGQAIKILLGTFGVALLLGTVGHKSNLVQKASRKFLNVFDFTLEKSAHKKSFNVGLSDNQNRFFIATAFIAYMDAVRDRLEGMEVFTRLAVTLSYLAFGNQVIDYFTQRKYEKQFPKLFVQALDENKDPIFDTNKKKVKRIIKIEELFEQFKVENKINEKNLLKEIKKTAHSLTDEQKKLAKSKLKLFIIPQIIGLSIAGFANAILNVVWTARRFKQNKGDVQQKANHIKAYNVYGDVLHSGLKAIGIQHQNRIQDSVYLHAFEEYHQTRSLQNSSLSALDPISRLLVAQKDRRAQPTP